MSQINKFEKDTKCLIVQTKFSDFSFWNYGDVCKIVGAKYPAAPLGLMTVAALLPQDWTFLLVDENVTPLTDEHIQWADIVCTGGMLPQQKSIIALIERIHDFGKLIVVGGPDPTSQPEFYKSADFLVLGEGEITIPFFLEALRNGATSGVFPLEERADMLTAVTPRYDLIKFEDYIMVGVQFIRGCPYNCEFCDIIELYGRVPRYKTNEQIIKELEVLYALSHRGHIDFVDDNFIGNRKKVKELLIEIASWSKAHKHPFFFSTEASLNLAEDDELLGLMKEVDFRYVFLGIETPETETLQINQKKQNVDKSVTDAALKVMSYGIVPNAGFILGFDTDSKGIADVMINCIEESGISMAMIGLLFALPNTQLTKRMITENRMENKDTFVEDSDVDQSTSGLNFITIKPKADILKDFIKIICSIYEPESFFKRVVYNGINIKPAYKYKPGPKKMLRMFISFLKVCRKMGTEKETRMLYWKMFYRVILKNPMGIETAVNLAAMFIHFSKQRDFIVYSLTKTIKKLEKNPEETHTFSNFVG